MQNEREPFSGRQPVEHHEQCDAYRVGQQRLTFGITAVIARDDRIRLVRVQGVLTPGGARPEHVQAYPRDHRRQPAAEVLDLAALRATEPKPALLDGVVRLVDRAEHPVGHSPQVRTVSLELVCQHLFRVHCHILVLRSVIEVTDHIPSM